MKSTLTRAPSCADDHDPAALTVDEARHTIQQHISPISGVEKRSLRSCLNRVLAEDIHSTIQVPAHTNSAMDGYAIAADDLPVDGIKKYRVIGTAFAGKAFAGSCKAGEVVRIMTGAVIPDGCDTVVMQEHIEIVDDTHIHIDQGHRSGQNVRQAGEDIDIGDIVLQKGRHIMPSDLGILASLGLAEIPVYRRPRVAFFSTGDELRSVGETLKKGEIYDSNRYTLYGMLKNLHVDILDMGVVRDNQQAMHNALQTAADMADIVITSGGVSVGEADYIKPTLDQLGSIHFSKVGMKPGRPLTFGSINSNQKQAHFFGLPGNPVSVMVTFYQFVQPAIHYLASGKTQQPITLKATCTSTLKKRSGRFEFQRGVYQQEANGDISVSKTGQQGSGVLTSMSIANCFILLPENATTVQPGDTVEIQPFNALN